MSDTRSSAKSPESDSRPASKFGGIPAFGIGIVILAALSTYSAMQSSRPDSVVPLSVPAAREPVTAAIESAPAASEPVVDGGVTSHPVVTDPDERYRQLALGTWQDFHHGKRTLIIRQDGTATMIVELSGWKARVFTRRLQLDIVWSIERGKMHRRTVGGVPADKVEFVNRRAGVAVAEPIIELTSDRMVLRDQDGSQDYHWRRIP